MYRLISITPTICRLMDVGPPEYSTDEVFDEVIEGAGGITVERCLVFAADALGEGLLRDHPEELSRITEIAPIEVIMGSMFPPKTPVCYASMFTGAIPSIHGISRYHKPELECDTIFDAFLRAGKKVAIIAVEGSSIGTIFGGRDLDYHIERYDEQVNAKAIGVIGSGDHDLIVIYNQEYDDVMHRTGPRSSAALEAMKRHIDSFVMVSNRFLARYRDRPTAVVFAPDHGAHEDQGTGMGDHGLDIPEDMEVLGLWGIH